MGFAPGVGVMITPNRVFALPAEPKEFAVIRNTARLRMRSGFLLDVASWIGHFDRHLRVADSLAGLLLIDRDEQMLRSGWRMRR